MGNVTALLASVAGAGEILVTAASARAAGVAEDLEHRRLELKGKTEAVDVLVLGATAPSS